ncbi:hypothetical protein Tco_1328210 [Tanacetum coccineum]
MTTLTDKSLLSGGPLVWPPITVDGATRPKEYTELTAAETIQADCDIKAINIIPQGIPPEIYALVSQHRIAKDIWEKIQLLMQGTSLTKQERECKLYDEFDKFTYKTGESLHYKFVTHVKLVKDLHTTNVDQIHAHLEQHERHANEVCLMHERNSDPLALVASHQMTQFPYQSHQHSYKNSQHQQQVSPYQSSQYGAPLESQQYSVTQSSTPLSITYPSNNYQSSVHHNVYSPSSSIPQLEYAPPRGDDPIDAINRVMSFLIVVVTFRYPTTNNQLRNSLNPRQQATINDGRVTLQPIQGRQTSFAAGTTRTYTPGASGSNSGKQRTEKVLLVQAQAHGKILNEEELAFLANPDIREVALMENLSHYGSDTLAEVHNHDNNMLNQVVQAMPSSEQSNVVNHSETEITSDSYIIPYSQYYVIESQQAAVQNSNSSAQQDALILSVIEQLKTQVVNCTKINLDNKSVNDTLTAELERYKEQVKVLKEGKNVDLRSNNNVLDSCAQSVEIDRLKQTLSEHLKEKESLMQTNSVNSPEPTLSSRPTKVEVPKELPKVSMVNTIGNACPLTRITTTTEVALYNETSKPVVTLVYSQKPRKSKSNVPVSKYKVLKSVSANKKEPSQSWGSVVSDVPSSSLDECRSSKLFSVKFGNVHVAKILGYGDYQIGNVTISRVYYVEGLGHNLFFVGKFYFDELTAMASEHSSSGPTLHEMTPATISSGLMPNPPPSTPFVPPLRTDWDILF